MFWFYFVQICWFIFGWRRICNEFNARHRCQNRWMNGKVSDICLLNIYARYIKRYDIFNAETFIAAFNQQHGFPVHLICINAQLPHRNLFAIRLNSSPFTFSSFHFFSSLHFANISISKPVYTENMIFDSIDIHFSHVQFSTCKSYQCLNACQHFNGYNGSFSISSFDFIFLSFSLALVSFTQIDRIPTRTHIKMHFANVPDIDKRIVVDIFFYISI